MAGEMTQLLSLALIVGSCELALKLWLLLTARPSGRW